MDIAICDDQPVFIESFSRQLSDYFEKKRLRCHLHVFSDGVKFLSSQEDYDIVFMDIRMDGMDGMEAARLFRKKNSSTRLVFLTAYKEYVFQAFDVDASHYLVKPINREKLYMVLDRLIKKLDEMQSQTLLIQKHSSRIRVPIHLVYYLEVMDRKIFVHTKNEVHAFYGKLEELQKQLPGCFFRCHRSYLVNLDSVMRFDKTTIYLTNDEMLPLSKRRYQEFSKAFFDSLRRGGPENDLQY